jgi:hypothetical protein
MTLTEFLGRHKGELAGLTVEHLFLVVIATGIAILIGVPLGILLTRKPALSKPVLGFANIMQTVPSLAIFGFLIPLNVYLFHVKILGGIGARTAIFALVLYALLPSFATRLPASVTSTLRFATRARHGHDRPAAAVPGRVAARSRRDHCRHPRRHRDLCRHRDDRCRHRRGRIGDYIFRSLRANDNV